MTVSTISKRPLRERLAILFRSITTKEDILASINYNIHLEYGLGNETMTSTIWKQKNSVVGELLQNQYRIGLSRPESGTRKNDYNDIEGFPHSPLDQHQTGYSSGERIFRSSQLSQFMDQNNPLGELTP